MRNMVSLSRGCCAFNPPVCASYARYPKDDGVFSGTANPVTLQTIQGNVQIVNDRLDLAAGTKFITRNASLFPQTLRHELPPYGNLASDIVNELIVNGNIGDKVGIMFDVLDEDNYQMFEWENNNTQFPAKKYIRRIAGVDDEYDGTVWFDPFRNNQTMTANPGVIDLIEMNQDSGGGTKYFDSQAIAGGTTGDIGFYTDIPLTGLAFAWDSGEINGNPTYRRDWNECGYFGQSTCVPPNDGDYIWTMENRQSTPLGGPDLFGGDLTIVPGEVVVNAANQIAAVNDLITSTFTASVAEFEVTVGNYSIQNENDPPGGIPANWRLAWTIGLSKLQFVIDADRDDRPFSWQSRYIRKFGNEVTVGAPIALTQGQRLGIEAQLGFPTTATWLVDDAVNFSTTDINPFAVFGETSKNLRCQFRETLNWVGFLWPSYGAYDNLKWTRI